MRPAPHIHTEKLLETLKDTNKTFKITFSSGGEPFLIPRFIDICISLTQKHFIALITNLTPHPIVSFAEAVDPKRVLYVHASLHIEELKKTRPLLPS